MKYFHFFQRENKRINLIKVRKGLFLTLICFSLFLQGITSLHAFSEEPSTRLSVNSTSSSLNLEVLFYDLYFEIDPINDHFQSKQNITILSLARSNFISFYIHSDLVINDIKAWDNETFNDMIISWETDYMNPIEFQASMEFVQVEVSLNNLTDRTREYNICLDYSIKPEAIADDVGEDLLRLSISKKGTRALGWPNGLIPVFNNAINYAAPHSLEIKHPNDMTCIATGKRVSTINEGEYIIESYLSDRLQSTAPSFSVDTYETMSLTSDNITVEFFYFVGEAISEEILEIILQGIIVLTNTLGDTGDRHYQFGFVEVKNSQVGGTSRRDTIFMRTGRFKNLDTNLKDKALLVTFLFHEISHNWNGFVQSDSWNGNDYFLWYQEGGANFLASYLCEKTMGTEAANVFRKWNLERYEQFKGFDSQYNIKNVPNIFLSELSDVGVAYEYSGAVWEQLLLKIGEEALFNGLADFTKNYWLNEEWRGMVTIYDLFDSFENYTEVDVEGYLDQWSASNAKIKLLVTDTYTEKVGDLYETTVEIDVVTDQDYEIFTSIGYETDSGLNLVDVHITERGKKTVKFTSEQVPESIQIDPEYRVPRIGVSNLPNYLLLLLTGLILITGSALLIFTIIKRRRKSQV